ncbi:MAG: BolA family protein [Gammaproteobacteria bacterium]
MREISMPPATPELIATIEKRLRAEFAPEALVLEDDSARHAGHPGAREGCHLRLRLVSARFVGLRPVARHRLVYATLARELAGPVHALNITALTPVEAVKQT